MKRFWRRHEQATSPSPQGDEVLAVFAELLPGDRRLSLGRTQASLAEQAAEVCVAWAVLYEQNERRAIGKRHFGAYDELYSYTTGFEMGLHDTVDTVTVGERHRGQAEEVAGLDEFSGMAGAFEKGEIALAPERNVAGHGLFHSAVQVPASPWSVVVNPQHVAAPGFNEPIFAMDGSGPPATGYYVGPHAS